MAIEFSDMLDQKLAEYDKNVQKQLAEHGYVKKSGSTKPNLDVDDADEAVLNAGVWMYETLRDKWEELIDNNGMTEKEARRFAFLRGPKEDPNRPKGRDYKKAVRDMASAFRDMYKYCRDQADKKFAGTGIDVDDLFSRVQFPQMMSRVIELPMMEPVEPIYALQGLFKRIDVPNMFGHVARFHFPVIGALTAIEAGEDAEAPEKEIELAGGTMNAEFAKQIVGFKYSQDFEKFQSFDWYNLVLRACRQALGRRKEVKAYEALSDNGVTVINNQGRYGFSGSPVAGTVGTAGTGVDGLRNGTHVLQDIFYMMTSFNDLGLTPDTLVQNPRGWLIWAQSPEMRAFAWENGMPRLWQQPQGQFGRRSEYDIFGGLNGHHGDHPRGSSTYTEMPNFLPLPLRMVVSPFVESGTDSGIEYTHMHMLDTDTGIGYLMQAQGIMMSQWDDPEHDLEKVKFTERYAFGTLQDSLTIRHMKYLKTRELGVDAHDKIRFSVNWSGGAGGPHIGNV